MQTDFEWFKVKMYHLTGIDLSLYKESQMKRRLNSLRMKRGITSFKNYYESMLQSKELLEECLDRMTINVTEFYRNRSRWEILDKFLIPKIRETSASMNVWSAACSTGEEPYTLSIILSKHFKCSEFNIWATDIDKQALTLASNGKYSKQALKSFLNQEREQFFVKEGSDYLIKDDYKSPIVFQKHNLLADPVNHKFDLIVCRNVLIYFTDNAKQMIYQKFSRALKPGGILFVGSTEQIFNPETYQLKSIESFFYEKLK
ncbi:CheR family methyltransferase [Scopulibacillus cellulosilyticus]|uniref:protein-glutamate O-methyltransferase n=1 Tax=Scopulibacillus cellulosilyticus TaxID=2665665 RepID=A0ABW2PSL9_9BACL